MPQRQPRFGMFWVAFLVFVVLFFGRSIGALVIDYQWWQEMGHLETWAEMLEYRFVPGIAAWAIAFAALWIAHARGMKHAGTGLGEHPHYAKLSTLILAALSFVLATGTMDGWTVARFLGGQKAPQAAGAWTDPVFGEPLRFYFFDLPFYEMLITYIAATAFVCALAYYLAARGWQLKREMPGFTLGQELDLRDLRVLGKFDTHMLKGLVAAFLVAMAVQFWLGRYEMLTTDHGDLMTGIDYVQQNIGLPLQIAKAGFAVLAALLVIIGRRKLAIGCAAILVIDIVLPPLVSGVYVRPNELSLEKPYIERHIAATRSAFDLDHRTKEVEFPASKSGRIDFAANATLLDNVRLWDWRPFHDTLSQSQPLRPYTYADTDVDRYVIDGRLRQTLLAPRELDLNQLGAARDRWINRTLTFTHGYGFVMAEANRITEAGLPELLVQDAPLKVRSKSLNASRPEIYYGEVTGAPVFVRTTQPEFNYPSGSTEVNTRYEGKGGFPISPLSTRIAATLSNGDWNVVLTGAFTNESKMLVRRNILDRVGTLAPFLRWDEDPYLVTTPEGHLVWIIDGYLTSDSHPYARSISTSSLGRFNYIRNSVKATVDAYDGDAHLYIFDPDDALARAYEALFPTLFEPLAKMPAALREHARAPESMFHAQAELYRIFHMRDPESFYNKADLWDIATFTTGQGGEPTPTPPTYVIAQLPGEKAPEFLLVVPFTPRNKQNLIGLMAARCDGEHLGEIVYLQLPKQEVIQGPLQVEALINQDQNISKDLSLWNQQGSQVLRSQILTLPIDQTILYVAPIYIQAAQARMPQLRKVALVQGDTLIYADTYDQALEQLRAMQQGRPVTAPTGASPATSALPVPTTTRGGSDPRIDVIRMHLERYRQLSAQGKWAEAGKELEAVEAAAKSK
ncbi:MAG: UPF0182 family protein [Bryobacteraceae bacterium]